MTDRIAELRAELDKCRIAEVDAADRLFAAKKLKSKAEQLLADALAEDHPLKIGDVIHFRKADWIVASRSLIGDHKVCSELKKLKKDGTPSAIGSWTIYPGDTNYTIISRASDRENAQ
jgi:hypothetical protein